MICLCLGFLPVTAASVISVTVLIMIPSEFKPIVNVSSAYLNLGLTVTAFDDWAPEREQSVLALTEQSNVRRDHVRGDVAAAVSCKLQDSFRAQIADAGAKKSAGDSLENLVVSPGKFWF